MKRTSKSTRLDVALVVSGAFALVGVAASGCNLGDMPASGASADSEVVVLPANEGFDEPTGTSAGEGGAGTPSGDAQFGTLTGTITLTGSVPNLPPPTVQDQTVCKPAKIGNERLVVGEGGGIQNVFVYLAKPPKVKPPAGDEPDAEPAKQVFDNVECRFQPHAMVVEIGESVKVTNSDAVLHNTHTLPKRNDVFNQSLVMGQEFELSYSKPELVPVKCDVHAWMNAWHLVVPDARYASVTGADGAYTLEGLPYGKHKVTIVHEGGEQTFEVEIDAPTVTRDLSFSAADLSVASRVPVATEVVLARRP